MSTRRTGPPSRCGGFTFVELLTVVLVSTVVLLATLGLLHTQTRFYTMESEGAQLEGNLRGAAAVLSAALIGLSTSEWDVLAVSSDSIRIRAIRAGGVICSWRSVSGDIWYGMPSVAGEFIASDSAFAYDVLSDAWTVVAVAAVLTGDSAAAKIPACFYGDSTTATAPEVQVAIRLVGTSDTLKVGAPLSGFEHTTFLLSTRSGSGWAGAPGRDGYREGVGWTPEKIFQEAQQENQPKPGVLGEMQAKVIGKNQAEGWNKHSRIAVFKGYPDEQDQE